MIGHNRGPAMDAGVGWRRHCWGRARAELMPKLPLEVIRLRVARARELGLDYRRYAGIRASTGRDVIAFLFSQNAVAPMEEGRMARLAALGPVSLRLAAHPPEDAAALGAELAARGIALDGAFAAPTLLDSWSETGRRLRAGLSGLPADGVVVIGATMLEARWVAAARLGGHVPAGEWCAPRRGEGPRLTR